MIAGIGLPAHDAPFREQAECGPHRRARNIAQRGNLLLRETRAGFETALARHIQDALRQIEMVCAGSSGCGLHDWSRWVDGTLLVWPIAGTSAIGQILRSPRFLVA